MPQLLPDGLSDPAVVEPVTQDVIEYGEAWEFHMDGDCGCTEFPVEGTGMVFDGGTHSKVTTQNLLDADTAHLHQSQGRWVTSTNAPTLEAYDEPRAWSGKGLRATCTVDDAAPRWLTSLGIAYSSGDERNVGYWVRSSKPVRLWVQLRAYDGGVFINRQFTEINLSADEWTFVTQSFSGSHAADNLRVYMEPHIDGPDAFEIGDTFEMYNMMIRSGTSPQTADDFVPSTRLAVPRILVDLAADDWTQDGPYQTIIDSQTGESGGFIMQLKPGGQVLTGAHDGTSVKYGEAPPAGQVDGERCLIDAVYSGGYWYFDVNGDLSSSNTGGGLAEVSNNDLTIGTKDNGSTDPFSGVVYNLKLYDGYGPLVAEFVTTAYGSYWTYPGDPNVPVQPTKPAYPHLAVRGNKVQRVTEEQTLEQWVTMVLATDRYRWEIYDNQYGTEFDQLIESSVPEDEAESNVIRAISDALLVDPRIASVTSVGVTDGRSLGNPSSFVAEVRVVTFTGELRRLQLDLSNVRTLDAYLNS